MLKLRVFREKGSRHGYKYKPFEAVSQICSFSRKSRFLTFPSGLLQKAACTGLLQMFFGLSSFTMPSTSNPST